MIYKPENGDIVRMLPILKKDGTTAKYLSASYMFESGKMLYDRHGLIDRLWQIQRKRGESTSSIGRRHFVFVEVRGEYGFMHAGASVMKAAKEILSGHDFSQSSLKIVKRDMHAGAHSFPAYDESEIVESKWDAPAEEERIEWLKQRQPFYIEDWIDQRGPLRNMDLLRERFGESIAMIVAEDREKRLEDLGI
jgi:hypothetical protein